jgi:hypothetical protein
VGVRHWQAVTSTRRAISPRRPSRTFPGYDDDGGSAARPDAVEVGSSFPSHVDRRRPSSSCSLVVG